MAIYKIYKIYLKRKKGKIEEKKYIYKKYMAQTLTLTSCRRGISAM